MGIWINTNLQKLNDLTLEKLTPDKNPRLLIILYLKILYLFVSKRDFGPCRHVFIVHNKAYQPLKIILILLVLFTSQNTFK